MLNKVDSCCKLFKYILFSWFCAVIIFLPLWVIVYWKPYVLHCETKLERSNEISEWCLKPLPNVYNYIQYIYWDNMLLGVFQRKPENFLVCIPMNVIFFFIISKVFKAQGASFILTLGLWRNKVEKTSQSIFEMPAIIPHFWCFTVHLSLILFFANAEINSRVASTIPFYYWAVAAIVTESKAGEFVGSSKIAKLAVVHNMAYLVLNLIFFPMNTAFF
jgi:hypothetical protein